MRNKNAKKRQASATLASVVKEMAKPRLAASVGRNNGNHPHSAILQTVQKETAGAKTHPYSSRRKGNPRE